MRPRLHVSLAGIGVGDSKVSDPLRPVPGPPPTGTLRDWAPPPPPVALQHDRAPSSPPQEGQEPWPLKEKGSRRSAPQARQ